MRNWGSISQVLHILLSKTCRGGRAVGGFRCAKPYRAVPAFAEAEKSLMVSESESRNARNAQILHVHPEMRRSRVRRVRGMGDHLAIDDLRFKLSPLCRGEFTPDRLAGSSD